jgi:3-deoxy-7-phosphoheptulonate synthase
MWITLKKDAKIKEVQASLAGLGLWVRPFENWQGPTTALAVAAHSASVAPAMIAGVPGVEGVFVAPSKHPKVDQQAGQGCEFSGLSMGHDHPPILMAGPCGVESEEQIQKAAALVVRAGAKFLRGGAFKPRSSPYAFSGFGLKALAWLRSAADAHGLKVVTEVLSEANVEQVAEAADLIQVGSRNMQNFALLKAIGQSGRPALLKRGMAASIEDWLLAGEHLLAAGCPHVIFCERGIQSYDNPCRNLLDLGAVALLKHVHKQCVIVDPSHGAGRRDLILPLSKAALAAGADGLLIEVHPHACEARSDGPQALDLAELESLGRLFRHHPEHVPCS